MPHRQINPCSDDNRKRLWLLGMQILCLWLFASTTAQFVLAETSYRMPRNTKSADPTASVTTRIFVTRNQVRITLEEFTDDLVWLHGMEANDDGVFPADVLKEFHDLHRDFLADHLRLELADGTVLKPLLVDQGPYPFDEELLQNGATEFHLVKRKMSFTYEFKSPQQIDLITLRHTIVDDNFLYPAELSIDLFQGSSDLSIKSKLRVDTPMTVAFDWENPIPDLSASKEEIGQWLEAQQERMLGVTEFGSVYCWGYIEPRRVRVELLFPLNVLETMFQIPAKNPDYLDAAELDAAAERIKKFFAQGNPVTVDGKTIAAEPSKVDFFPADQRDFAIQQKIERLSFSNGRVGITIYYPYREVPQEVELKWDKFSRALNTVQAYLYFEDQVVGETFSRQLSSNRIKWTNPGQWQAPASVVPMKFDVEQTIPLNHTTMILAIIGSAVLAGGIAVTAFSSLQRPTRFAVTAVAMLIPAVAIFNLWPKTVLQVQQQAATEIATETIENIYHAFQFPDEEEVYDQLSQSVTGDQLRELYLQLLSGLSAEEQGGAVSSIESVDIVEVIPGTASVDRESLNDSQDRSPIPAAAFECQVKWNLKGLVEHWGHSHERTNQYLATATFLENNGDWKLFQLVVDSQSAGLTKPRPRKFSRTQSTEQ